MSAKDHAGIADRFLRLAADVAVHQGAGAPLVKVYAVRAQAEATLALVEQQRIANLIALADHSLDRFGNYAGPAGGMGTLFSYPQEENGNIQLREDIRKALGL